MVGLGICHGNLNNKMFKMRFGTMQNDRFLGKNEHYHHLKQYYFSGEKYWYKLIILRDNEKTHVTWCTDSLVWFLCLCISRCTFKFLSEISYSKIKIQNPHFDIELIMNWVFVQILKHSTCVKCSRNMLLASYKILRHQSDWSRLIQMLYKILS